MRKVVLPLLLLGGLVLGIAWATARSAPPDRIYSAAQVQAMLQRHPAEWAGRTVLVRGRIGRPMWVGFSTLPAEPIIDLPITTIDGRLPIHWSPPDAFLSDLNALPLVGHWFPPPQRLIWHRLAVYRVLLLAQSDCMLRHCYQAVLQNTISPDDEQIAFDATILTPFPVPTPFRNIEHTRSMTDTNTVGQP